MEVNRTKEDMKSLQNDLASADKEISVRQIKEIQITHRDQHMVVIPVLVSFPRV